MAYEDRRGRDDRRYQDRDRERPPEKKLEEIFQNYLGRGFFDNEGYLFEYLIRRKQMRQLAEELSRAYPPLTSSQVRRFYNHCWAVKQALASHEWGELRDQFAKLDKAAADAYGKTPHKIPKLFHDFIAANTEAVKTRKDFEEGFLPHFEALVGFGSGLFKEERKG